jgi:YVTN family beta-propeller protein
MPSFAGQGIAHSSASSTSIKLIATVPAGLNPQFLTYDPFNKLVYAANLDDGGTYARDTVSVISGTKNVANITVGESPYGIIYNPSNHEIYVADSAIYAQTSKGYQNAGVSVIKGTRLVKTLLEGTVICFLVYNPSNNLVYAADEQAVFAINSTNTVVATISMENVNCIHPIYDPSNHEVYVAHTDTNGNYYLAAIYDKQVVADISLGGGGLLNSWGQTLAYDPANKCIYASGSGVIVINGTTNRLIGQIAVGGEIGIKYDPANNDVYVAGGEFSDNISVISSRTNRVVATVNVSSSSFYFAYDSLNKDMYVTTGDGVAVISPSNKVVTTIVDSNQPQGIIYDPSNTYVYVSNFEDGIDTISVLSS